MRATRIKMKDGSRYSNDLLEIDDIYVTGWQSAGYLYRRDGYYKKAIIHDHLKLYPGTIQVNIYPYPNCLPVTSRYEEKYVRSSPNDTTKDNLLELPRD
jgi:hypothetical protein